MSREVKVGNEWVRVAGRGKAEYGASHYQTGTVHDIAVGANSHTVVEVTMDSAMPDTDYIVTFEHLSATHDQDVYTLWGTASKTTTSFKVAVINAGAADTVSFRWKAFKLYSDKEYDGLLDDVATLKTMTSGTATVNTVNLYNSGTQVSNCSYRKCGKTVQVQFTAFFKTALTWSSTDMVLFSGLPKAVSTITPICYNLSKNTICDVQMNIAGSITSFDGINGTVAVNDRVTGSFCYLTAE